VCRCAGADCTGCSDGYRLATAQHRLYRFGLNLTRGHREQAEDIVRETMLRTRRHPEVVEGRGEPIQRWLSIVTRHVPIDLRRTRLRSEEVVEVAPPDRQTRPSTSSGLLSHWTSGRRWLRPRLLRHRAAQAGDVSPVRGPIAS
jgi:DNA-directed RNA polymerase specialized sigma24 family protein